MAKYTNSGLIPFIKGSLGDVYFTYWKGIPVIRKNPKKKRNTRTTPHWQRVKEANFMLQHNWRNLSFKEWALWEEYTKRYRNIKNRHRDGLCTHIGNKMSGYNAYTSVNLLLIFSGFEPIEKPFLGNTGKPPLPSTDLIYCGVYQDEIKFNIWLPSSYPVDCVAQIWTRKAIGIQNPHLARIIKISTAKTQVTIDKIKMRDKNKKATEKGFESMENCKLYLQLRTIAQNGEFSVPSHIYKLEVKSPNFKNRKSTRGILKLFRRHYTGRMSVL